MEKSVAFVTGYIGRKGLTNIPSVPLKGHSYFVTDNRIAALRATVIGWKVISISAPTISSSQLSNYLNIRDLGALDARQKRIYLNTLKGKKLKVFPECFLPMPYQFVIWFDNKFDVNKSGTLKTVRSFPPKYAIVMHRHPVSKNVEDEYNASMLQIRYTVDSTFYKKAIEINNNRPSKKSSIYFQAGFIIYNMNHPQTIKIKESWYDTIFKFGINDQISFNLLTEDYIDCIGEFNFPISS